MADGLPPTVVLLRSADESNDRYVHAFEEDGFQALCLPVLVFRFHNQHALRGRLARPDWYAGVIVTSPRAVRAVEQTGLTGENREAWIVKSAYAVGPKTASELRTLGFVPDGEQSGDAKSLASVITHQKRPYLFLCGNRRRDVLPDALRDAGTPFEELTVYETAFRTTVDLPHAQAGDWLVFFSPSGVEVITQYAADVVSGYRLAAIGTTTARALRERGWEPEAVAERPSPGGLTAAIGAASSVR